MFRVGFAAVSTYRAEVFIWILTTNLPLIMYAVWATVAKLGPVGDFDESAFASYFVAVIVTRQIGSAWVVWELNEQIRTGRLSGHLLRPATPLLYWACENLAALPLRAIVIVPMICVGVMVLPPLHFSTSPVHIALFVTTALLGWLLTFLIQASVGLLATYTDQSYAIQDAWFGVWALLSGYMIPLDVVPWLKRVAEWLPFRAQGMLAAEIIIGRLDGVALWSAVAAQLGWIAVALGTLRWLWPRAMRRFEAYGG